MAKKRRTREVHLADESPHSTKQSRAWVFTLNNPPEGFCPSVWPSRRYLVYQLERGKGKSATCPGQLHLQGYIIFDAPKRLSTIRKLDSQAARAHWEPRRGTHAEAQNYCTKCDTRVAGPFTFGVPPSGHGSSSFSELKDMVDQGCTLEDVRNKHYGMYLRYYSVISRDICSRTPPRSWKTEVVVLTGRTGLGKSRWAHTFFPGAYWKPKSQWWDGYSNQSVVVLDDFYGWLKYDLLRS